MKWILFAAIGVILIMLVAGCDTEMREAPRQDALGAYTAAKMYVKERLRSPATADFPWRRAEDVATFLGDDTYKVVSYVDSQNGFGAVVRMYFVAEVKGYEYDWTLIDLTFFKK